MRPTDRTRPLLIALTAIALSALGAVSPVRAADAAITIKDFAFDPNPVTVTAGSVVTWTNTAGQAHTVTSDTGGTLASGPIGPGEAYGNLFDAPGTYAYHCEIHPTRMKGTIIVTAAAPTPVASGSPTPAPPAGTLPPGFRSPSAVPEATLATTPSPSPARSPGTSGDTTGSSGAPLLLILAAIIAIGVIVGLLAARMRRSPRA